MRKKSWWQKLTWLCAWWLDIVAPRVVMGDKFSTRVPISHESWSPSNESTTQLVVGIVFKSQAPVKEWEIKRDITNCFLPSVGRSVVGCLAQLSFLHPMTTFATLYYLFLFDDDDVRCRAANKLQQQQLYLEEDDDHLQRWYDITSSSSSQFLLILNFKSNKIGVERQFSPGIDTIYS